MVNWRGKAKVEANGSLTLPKEAQEALGLKPGEEIRIVLYRKIADEHDALSGAEEALLQQSEANVDAVEHQPTPYSDPQKEAIAKLLAKRYLTNPRLRPPMKSDSSKTLIPLSTSEENRLSRQLGAVVFLTSAHQIFG